MLDSSVELASAKDTNGLSASATATIPIVFFGRLEERKGLCTFLEAIRLLSPDIWPNLRITFMGKVVPLYSEALRHMDSKEYIQQEFGTDLQYEICSNLFSQEAIQRVREIQPIVCLASPQENFPNSALEMGQVPVGLVVSKTGGFEETLALVKRTEGVYWFTPGNAVSLSAALEEAIAHYPKTYPVATRSELEQVNAALLEDKRQHIERAFQQARSFSTATPQITAALVCPELTAPVLETLASLTSGGHGPETILFHGEPLTDAAKAVLAQIAAQFSGVRLVPLGRSVNIGEAWNQLPALATGDYFLLLEAGWTLLPGGLDTLAKAAQRSHASVITCPRWNRAEEDTLVAFGSGTLGALMQGHKPGNLPALVARSFLQQYPLPEMRDLEISGWAVLAGAIATGTTPICCPYPLVQSAHETDKLSGLQTPRQQYYLRMYLDQIPPAQWAPRQLSMLLATLQYSSETNQQTYTTAQQALMVQQFEEQQNKLHEVQLKVYRSHKRLEKLTAELAEAEARIAEYEGSKFWKLQQWWKRMKRSLKRGES